GAMAPISQAASPNQPAEFVGKLDGVSKKNKDGQRSVVVGDRKFVLTSSTSVLSADGRTMSLDDLKEGTMVSIGATKDAAGKRIGAMIRVLPPGYKTPKASE